MARSRNIKPGFFTNEDLVELDFATRLLFAGLWTVADRDGRLQDRPKKIKIDIFPADNLDIDAMLQALHNGKFIVRYEIYGSKFIQISNWTKHQNPHHTEKASEIPGINAVLTVKPTLDNTQAPKQDGECLADSLLLIPDSLIPDSLIEIPQAAPATPAPVTKKVRARKPEQTGLPENFEISERVAMWAKVKKFDRLDEHLESFISKSKAKAYTYADWDEAFMGAVRDDWAKLKDHGQPINKQEALEARNRAIGQRWANGEVMPGAI